ncbi:menaquinone biosynthesis protein [soil metagenome]
MKPIRLGAVAYLNARPLVHGLEARPNLFTLEFDPPSRCAARLHEHSIDVGMIPTIEYCRGPEYRIVPGMGIVSDGAVASVALFTTKPLRMITTIAADTSSRTSNALLRILCRQQFGIDPEFHPMPPDAERMLQECDAALIIGDPALFIEPTAAGVEKIDLGEQWTSMTGLPFVWAFWAGRPDALDREALDALTEARDAGVAASDQVATDYCGPERAPVGRAYLRDNIHYYLGEREEAGLRRYYELAAAQGLIDNAREPLFYQG